MRGIFFNSGRRINSLILIFFFCQFREAPFAFGMKLKIFNVFFPAETFEVCGRVWPFSSLWLWLHTHTHTHPLDLYVVRLYQSITGRRSCAQVATRSWEIANLFLFCFILRCGLNTCFIKTKTCFKSTLRKSTWLRWARGFLWILIAVNHSKLLLEPFCDQAAGSALCHLFRCVQNPWRADQPNASRVL